jgi:hypothetical protein
VSKAKFLRTYSREVTFLWQNEKPGWEAASEHGFARDGPIDGLKLERGVICASIGQRVLHFDVMYPALGCDVCSDLLPGWVPRRPTLDV